MNLIKKTKKAIIISISFLGFFLLFSCEYKKIKNNSENFRYPQKLSKEEIEGLSFQKVMDEVLDPYCLSCHRDRKKGNVPLTSYQEVYSVLSEIKTTVFIKGTMPKKKILPDRARSVLFSWIEAGAPEIGKSPPQIKPPLLPQFSSIRERIFDVRCGNCHNPLSAECQSLGIPGFKYGEIESPEEGGYSETSCQIELSVYNELVFGIEERRKESVLPGDPDNSQLVLDITKYDEKAPKMPPAENGYSPLSDEEIQVIRDWIKAGALEN